MRKGTQIVFLAVVAAILTSLPALTVYRHVLAPQTIDANENRGLAAFPDFTRQALTTTFFSDLETFVKDHFYQRPDWMRANTVFELNVLRKRIVAGVIPTSEAIVPYIPYTGEHTPQQRQALAEQRAEDYRAVADAMAEWGGVFLLAGLPTQVVAQSEWYPAGVYNAARAQSENMDALFSALEKRGVPYLDLREVYLDKGGYGPYYLKTDHHQTLDGALAAYEAIHAGLRTLGVIAAPLPELDRRTLPNPVLGSRARQLYGASPLTDCLEVAVPCEEIVFRYQDTYGVPLSKELCVLPETAGETVAYSMYMGGDAPESIIQTARPELPNALIYGDSYTNIIETLFYTGFNETRSLDLRHYKGSLLDYVKTYRPDAVVLVRDSSVILNGEGNGRIGAAEGS